jgi:hypothetical protein
LKLSKVDWQAERIYAAEWIVRKHFPQRMFSLKETRRFVESVVRSEWFRRFSVGNIIVCPSRARTPSADAKLHTIYMPVWSREPIIILHEIAHVCNQSVKNKKASHGKSFVENFLYLAKHCLYKDEYGLLISSLRWTKSFSSTNKKKGKK